MLTQKAYANKIAVSTGGGSHYLKHTDNNSPEAVRDTVFCTQIVSYPTLTLSIQSFHHFISTPSYPKTGPTKGHPRLLPQSGLGRPE